MKDFIIIGPKTACQYQNTFPLIKEGVCFIGVTHPNNFNGGHTMTNWYNSVGVHSDRKLVLTKSYYENPSAYPKYDNFDAIEVGRVKDIPYDYDGLMGVPITFLDYWYPGFEIVGLNNDSRTEDFKYLLKGSEVPDKNGVPRFGVCVNGEFRYTRLIIEGIAAEIGGGFSIKGEKTYVDEKHKNSTAMVLNKKRKFGRVILRGR